MQQLETVVLTNELLGGIRKLDFLVKLTKKNRHNHHFKGLRIPPDNSVC